MKDLSILSLVYFSWPAEKQAEHLADLILLDLVLSKQNYALN